MRTRNLTIDRIYGDIQNIKDPDCTFLRFIGCDSFGRPGFEHVGGPNCYGKVDGVIRFPPGEKFTELSKKQSAKFNKPKP